jgi:hypothetical protein
VTPGPDLAGGETPGVLTGDAGCSSQANVEHCEARGILPVISPGRERSGQHAEAAAKKSAAAQRMRGRLRDPQGDRLHGRRKTITGPVVGPIKEARGFRRFPMRGLAKVRDEWSPLRLTHDLLEPYRATAQPPLASASASGSAAGAELGSGRPPRSEDGRS